MFEGRLFELRGVGLFSLGSPSYDYRVSRCDILFALYIDPIFGVPFVYCYLCNIFFAYYKNICAKNTGKINMQKFLNIYYTLICAIYFFGKRLLTQHFFADLSIHFNEIGKNIQTNKKKLA